MKIILWILVALLGTFALATIALSRGESINALWLITAAVCIYAVAYRFYAAWIAAKVLSVDATRATPAERLESGWVRRACPRPAAALPTRSRRRAR